MSSRTRLTYDVVDKLPRLARAVASNSSIGCRYNGTRVLFLVAHLVAMNVLLTLGGDLVNVWFDAGTSSHAYPWGSPR